MHTAEGTAELPKRGLFTPLQREPWDHIKYSEMLTDMATGEILVANRPTIKRPAASLAKLYIAGATIALAERGEVQLDSQVRLHAEELEQIAHRPGELRLHQRIFHAIHQHTNLISDQLTFPLGALLIESVRKSDNLATLLAVNTVGRQRIQQVLEDFGLHDTTILDEERGNPNVTTAQDMGKFLSGIYSGEFLTNTADQREFASWMRQKHMYNTGGDVTARFKEGRVREGNFSYWHEAGFMSVNDGRFAYAVMSEDQPVNNTDGSYPQSYTVKQAVDVMSWRATERVVKHPF